MRLMSLTLIIFYSANPLCSLLFDLSFAEFVAVVAAAVEVGQVVVVDQALLAVVPDQVEQVAVLAVVEPLEAG